jgi:hypothetical protein
MDAPVIHNEATHHAIVEACGPPNILLGAPMEVEQEPQLLLLGSPGPEKGSSGPEKSPNVVGNGSLSVVATITNKLHIRQPTGQVPQPSSTKNEAI